MGGIECIAYHSCMGLADYTLADTLMMGHGGILMAVEGYGESGYEAAARGLSPDAIQMLGINSAMSNVLTDKILLRACRGQHGFVRSVTEGSAGAAYEWLLTDTVDNWVSGDLSREDTYYRAALAEGQTPEEAKATICEIRKQELLQAMAVGGTMSGMAWVGGRAYDYVINRINPGQVSPDTPESVNPLQEEGVSEILGGGDGGVGLREGDESTLLRTQKDVEMPILPTGSQWERNVLNSFSGGEAIPVTYQGGTILYRVGGNNGGFWSLDPPPATEYQWRVDYAIKQEFCNDASILYKLIIPEGSTLTGLEGVVGTQGMGLYGGAHQVYIDYREVPVDWIEVLPIEWK